MRTLALLHIILTFALLFWAQKSQAKWIGVLEYQTPVKDQGDYDHCAFYATSALMETALKVRFNKEFNISEKFEVHRSKALKSQDVQVAHGDTEKLVMNFAQDRYFMDQSERRISYSGFAAKPLTKLWSSRSWAEQIAEQLQIRRAVVITLKVAVPYADKFSGVLTYNEQIDQKCARKEISCGGHAVLIVAFNPERNIFMFKNSWGPGWGQKGYGFATAEHINKYSDRPVTGYFDPKNYNALND